MKKSLTKMLSIMMVFAVLFSFALPVSASAAPLPAGIVAAETDATAEAFVTKTNGNSNLLTIIINDNSTAYEETFVIANNADGLYEVGGFTVYVGTYGNTKISACVIVDIPEEAYLEIASMQIGEIDIDLPFFQTATVVTDSGGTIEIGVSYTPDLIRNTAVVGTWSVWSTGYVPAQSYSVDMVRNGSGWRLENARNHSYSGAFMNFPSSSLSIGRANSTTSLAAEATGSVNWNLFDTTWIGPIASGKILLIFTVTHSGAVSSSIKTN
jgi:hypothetical protein